MPSDQNENLENNQEIITVDLNLEKDTEAPKLVIANEINVESARYTISGTVEDDSNLYMY